MHMERKLTVVALVGLVGVGLAGCQTHSVARTTEAPAQLATTQDDVARGEILALKERVMKLEAELRAARAAQPAAGGAPTAEKPVPPPGLDEETKKLILELKQIKVDHAELESEVAALQERLKALEAKDKEIRDKVGEKVLAGDEAQKLLSLGEGEAPPAKPEEAAKAPEPAKPEPAQPAQPEPAKPEAAEPAKPTAAVEPAKAPEAKPALTPEERQARANKEIEEELKRLEADQKEKNKDKR